MEKTEKIEASAFREKLPEFREKTMEFYNGDLLAKDYKGISGKYGSYAQRGGKASMLRLRMPAGELSKKKLNFILDAMDRNDVDLAHYTTCQTVQLHNLKPDAVFDIIDDALNYDIVCYGGGGDYPRNVMCSPLSGVEKGEYFDVTPYAKAMSDFLMHFIDLEKMPRKLKVAFSNSPENVPHATFRDLGFVAREDGNFDVYAAGGLGGNPRFGVKVGENVNPEDILRYAEAMIKTFRKYGNYTNRAKARTRFMVETLGGEEEFVKAFQEELADTEPVKIKNLEVSEVTKKGDGVILEESFKVIPQKQEGLYAVKWHPIGGSPKKEVLRKVAKAIEPMEEVKLRLSPDETVYIVNLNGTEAKEILDIIEEDAAGNPLEASVACIGASICQVGVRDSQAMLHQIVDAVREAGLPDNALPTIHISGCPSSCGTHQIGSLGFRGGVKMVDKKPVPAFIFYAYGNDKGGQERMGREVGAIAIEQIPEFLVKLGKEVAKSGMDYEAFTEANPQIIDEVAAEYIA